MEATSQTGQSKADTPKGPSRRREFDERGAGLGFDWHAPRARLSIAGNRVAWSPHGDYRRARRPNYRNVATILTWDGKSIDVGANFRGHVSYPIAFCPGWAATPPSMASVSQSHRRSSMSTQGGRQ